MRRAIAAVLWALALLPAFARADDFGPARDVRTVRSSAGRLLAHQLRASGVDLKTLDVFDVVVEGNAAVLSWSAGNRHRIMGLTRRDNRWWEVADLRTWPARGISCLPPEITAAAALHNADVRAASQLRVVTGPPLPCRDSSYYAPASLAVQPAGATVIARPGADFQFGFTMRYAPNDARGDARLALIYVRAPTSAEFLPFPAPPKDWGGSTDVGFFDVGVAGSKPVTFTPGTAVDIWFPFVLDDTLRYDVSYFTDGKSYGPYHGTLFDNVLHFELPAFTVTPDAPLQAEISGWY